MLTCFVLALFFALAICALYIFYKVAEGYLIDKYCKYGTWSIDDDAGMWVVYIFNGQEIEEQVLVRGFKPVFTHFPETGEIVFETVEGKKIRVHTDQWALIDVPEEDEQYDD